MARTKVLVTGDYVLSYLQGFFTVNFFSFCHMLQSFYLLCLRILPDFIRQLLIQIFAYVIYYMVFSCLMATKKKLYKFNVNSRKSKNCIWNFSQIVRENNFYDGKSKTKCFKSKSQQIENVRSLRIRNVKVLFWITKRKTYL